MPRKSHTLQENLIARVLDEVGLRYTWQTPVGKYVPDFVITEMNVIIEADGPFGHFAKRDALRDEYLKKAGYEIVHIKEKTYKDIKAKIWQELKL